MLYIKIINNLYNIILLIIQIHTHPTQIPYDWLF